MGLESVWVLFLQPSLSRGAHAEFNPGATNGVQIDVGLAKPLKRIMLPEEAVLRLSNRFRWVAIARDRTYSFPRELIRKKQDVWTNYNYKGMGKGQKVLLMQTFGAARHPLRGIYGVGEIKDCTDAWVDNNVTLRYLPRFADPIPVHPPYPRQVASMIEKIETPKLRSLLLGVQENQRNFVPIAANDIPVMDGILRLLQEGRSYDVYTAFAKEGKKLTQLHIRRERNPKVIEAAKAMFMKANKGRLFCEACDFDFLETYGDRGYGFIEGHHRVPLSKLARQTRTKPTDIVLLCSNCHRMIHRQEPWISVQNLGQLVRQNRKR